MANIVIVDDDDDICKLFSRILKEYGHEARIATTAIGLFELLSASIPEVILLDVNLPDAQGYELVPQILQVDPFIHVLMISGEMTVEAAMAALKMGAFDYLAKPFTKTVLIHAIDQALAARRMNIYAVASERVESHSNVTSNSRLTGSTRAICTFNMILDRMAKQSNVPILILGEIGTPKEESARAIHELSNRCENPFFHLKCSTIPRPLMMSELFGDVNTQRSKKSLGLLRLTEGGTLYLSEAEFLDSRCFQALTELINDQLECAKSDELQVGTRLIFSVNSPINELIRLGDFNEELNEILRHSSLTIPTLVSQFEDLDELSNHYLKEINQKLGRHFMGFSPDLMKFFRSYSWPGNHRELYNLIERIVLLTPKEQVLIDIGVLKKLMFLDPTTILNDGDFFTSVSINQEENKSEDDSEEEYFFEPIPLAWVEKEYIIKVLRHLNYDLASTALQLGLSTSALHRKLVVHDILTQVEEFHKHGLFNPTPKPEAEQMAESNH